MTQNDTIFRWEAFYESAPAAESTELLIASDDNSQVVLFLAFQYLYIHLLTEDILLQHLIYENDTMVWEILIFWGTKIAKIIFVHSHYLHACRFTLWFRSI